MKTLRQVGDLILRYVQKKQPKHADRWEGPFLVQEQFGRSMAKSLNVETMKTVYVLLNNLKRYSRPSTSEWKVRDANYVNIWS